MLWTRELVEGVLRVMTSGGEFRRSGLPKSMLVTESGKKPMMEVSGEVRTRPSIAVTLFSRTALFVAAILAALQRRPRSTKTSKTASKRGERLKVFGKPTDGMPSSPLAQKSSAEHRVNPRKRRRSEARDITRAGRRGGAKPEVHLHYIMSSLYIGVFSA